MRYCFSLLALLAVLAGCQGPILTGGFNHSPYRAYGVDGPGPGVIPENYQSTGYQTPPPAAMPGMPVHENTTVITQEIVRPMMPPPMMMVPMGPTSQINFLGLESLTINWDAKVPGTYDSEPLVCPATHDFGQGHIYRIKLSNIPGRQGKELYPTLEIAPTMARTQAFLAHNSIPIEFTDNDFDQVLSGNFITKVIYLPNPEYQGLAMAGVGTLVNTQLEPGVDPIVEASNRGAILAVIRMGNKDLSMSAAEIQRRKSMAEAMMVAGLPSAPAQPGVPVMGVPMGGSMPGQPMMGPGAAYPINGSSIPQNMISGVNIPPYGTPMTKTTTGIPGPPQLPQGMHSPNRYPVVRAEPIPAPPRPVGIDAQNVVMYPQYTSHLQDNSFPMQPMMQPMPTTPTLAPPRQQLSEVGPVPTIATPSTAPAQQQPLEAGQ